MAKKVQTLNFENSVKMITANLLDPQFDTAVVYSTIATFGLEKVVKSSPDLLTDITKFNRGSCDQKWYRISEDIEYIAEIDIEGCRNSDDVQILVIHLLTEILCHKLNITNNSIIDAAFLSLYENLVGSTWFVTNRMISMYQHKSGIIRYAEDFQYVVKTLMNERMKVARFLVDHSEHLYDEAVCKVSPKGSLSNILYDSYCDIDDFAYHVLPITVYESYMNCFQFGDAEKLRCILSDYERISRLLHGETYLTGRSGSGLHKSNDRQKVDDSVKATLGYAPKHDASAEKASKDNSASSSRKKNK